jgi:hypothetical protein
VSELRKRLEFWFSLGVCWGAALLALYVHPAFWAAFGLVTMLIVTRAVRKWK